MLSRSKICIAIGALAPVAAMAGPFSPFEARGFAMGGAGVASAEYAAASLYNPALLAVKTDSTRFSFIAPSLGVSATGNEGAFKNAQDFADNKSLDGFSDAAKAYENALSAYQYNQSDPNGPTLTQSANSLKTASDALLKDLQSVNQKASQVGAGGTLAIALPRWEYKGALSISTEAAARVTLDVASSDTAQLNTTVNDVVSATKAITDANNGSIPTNNVVNSSGELILNGDNVASKAHVLGVAVTDIGLSMARQFSIQDHSFLVGITPKIQNVATVAKSVDIDTGDTKVNDTKKTYTGFNVDVGLAKQFEEGTFQNVRVGFVVRNLIPHTYKTMDPNQDVKITPQARIGAAYSTKFYTLTSDFDLTSNKIVGQGKEASQYVAFGAELNAWSVAKLRAGFRNDLKSKISTVTAGFSLLGVQVSAAYAQDREAALLMQFSGTF